MGTLGPAVVLPHMCFHCSNVVMFLGQIAISGMVLLWLAVQQASTSFLSKVTSGSEMHKSAGGSSNVRSRTMRDVQTVRKPECSCTLVDTHVQYFMVIIGNHNGYDIIQQQV